VLVFPHLAVGDCQRTPALKSTGLFYTQKEQDMSKIQTWYIEGFASWFLVKARTKAQAKSEGVRQFGRGYVKVVRIATKDEISYFVGLKGEIGEAE